MYRKVIALETLEKIIRQFEFGRKPSFNYISECLSSAFGASICGYLFWNTNNCITESTGLKPAKKGGYKEIKQDPAELFQKFICENKRNIISKKCFEIHDFSSFDENGLQFFREEGVDILLCYPVTGISVSASGCYFFGFKRQDSAIDENLSKAGELASEMTASYIFNINALNLSEKKFQNLVEHTNDIVYSLDKNGFITYINNNVEKYGYIADKLVGGNVFDYIHPDDRDAMLENFHKSFEDDKETLSEYRIRDAFGNYNWFEHSSKANHDTNDNVIGISGFARNINERKAAEEALKASEEKYRILVERATDGICIIAGEEILYANPKMEKMTGRKTSELVGNSFMPLFSSDQMVKVAHKYMLHMNGEENPQTYQTVLENTDGEKIEVEYSASLIDYGGEKASLVFIHDLSERKKAEQALIRSERLAAVGTLAGGIAHEFNNINVTILGFTQLALERKDIDDELRDWLKRIHKASNRAGKITRNLLTFSRPDNTEHKNTNISNVIDDVINLIIRELESDGIKIVLQLGQIPSIVMDENQVGQVVLNMLINARHAMLGRPGKEIIVSTSCDSEFIYIVISDTGCGISKSDMKNIFSPFFTTKGEHNREKNPQSSIRGTGLGLSISDSIIAKHGGSITVKSEIDVGTSFTIKLPVNNDFSEKNIVIDQEQIRPTKVVIIEEENDYRSLIKMLLEKQKYDVFCTDDLIESIDHIREGDIDLLVADIGLLKDFEKEFFNLLSNLAPAEKPEVVLITSEEPEKNMGFSNYSNFAIVKKPFELDFFCEIVYSAIAKKRGH